MPSTRRQLLAGASVATAALAGCTTVRRSHMGDYLREAPERRVDADWRPGPGTWADSGYGPANTRNNPHANPPRTSPEVRWRYDLPETPNSLVVAEGRVYCSTASRVVALDTETGKVRWEYDTGAVGFLKYVDGRLYVTNTNEEIAALSPGGRELWKTTIDAEALKGFHEQSGYVFLGTFSGHRVLHADTGTVVRARDVTWEFLASVGGSVYTTKGSAPGTPTTFVIDGRRLKERWRVETACSVSRPVVASGHVYYSVDPEHNINCSGQHRVWAHDATGERQWEATYEHDLRYLAAADNHIFVPTGSDDGSSGSLVHLGRDGERRWIHGVSGGLRDPTIAGGTVYAGPSRVDGAPLLALDIATGECLWTRDLSRDVRIATAGNTLYVGDDDGLVALQD